ncbi:UNVERIFIED_CONTAM: hypothetical protein GTU68_047791, partial [Idotea baltica]|nr:hypothetical protein [Idotea baltica]
HVPQVSWIRGRDLHVLSSGLIVFATDSRVSVSAMESAWTLTISYSQPRDGGAYACQINTQPPIASWLNLTVIGNSDLFTLFSRCQQSIYLIYIYI